MKFTISLYLKFRGLSIFQIVLTGVKYISGIFQICILKITIDSFNIHIVEHILFMTSINVIGIIKTKPDPGLDFNSGRPGQKSAYITHTPLTDKGET